MVDEGGHIDGLNGLSGEALREQGNTLEGKVNQAIKSYSKAAAIAPTDPKPYSNLSAAHFEIGDYRQCIKDIAYALYARFIKSSLYIKDVQAAEANCALLGDHPDKAASRTSSLAVSNLIRALARYLSTLDDNPEYYPVGHDKACSQVDKHMLRKAVKKPVSLFFGGIGDARNLYATLIETARLETVDSRPPKRKYHVIVNDLKAPALARDLVMFYLLDDLAKMESSGGELETEHCTVILYLFTASILPPFAARRIQETIKRAHEPLLHIAQKGMVGWKNGKEYVCRHWEVNVTLTDEAWTESRRWDWVYGVIGFDPFENMEALYELTGLPLPKNQTSLYEFVAAFFQRVAQSLQKLRNRLMVEMLLGEVWGNLDMIQHKILDRDQSFPHSYDRIHLSNIPINGHSQLPPNTPKWKNVDEFHCEYLATSDRDLISKVMRTSVPELLAVKEQKAMSMVYNNPELFQSLDPAILGRVGLEHIRDMDPDVLRKSDVRSLTSKDLDDDGVIHPLAEYLHWPRTSHFPLPFDQLLPRSKITTWLFTMFFKIVLPADRGSQAWDILIYAPLNLTIFIRILSHLNELGYPAHWLSAALVQILEDEVTTSARPPETSPLSLAEARRENSTKRLTTAPFVTEMVIMTAMFLPLLPFAVITSALPNVDRIHEYKIAFKVKTHFKDGLGLPVFVLIFWESELAETVLGYDLEGFPEMHQIFHPEGCTRYIPIQKEKLQEFRQQGLKMMTTLRWNTRDSTAEFWIYEDAMDGMQRSKGWKCALLRTDRWEFASLSVRVSWTKKCPVRKGRRWIDWGEEL
ncbi:MAG: hypothetical protein LQ349_007983 [Xanthoria aureola]|nr:MAG: hypothetical protein LQ349_007983 [Xanthoria aureola]